MITRVHFENFKSLKNVTLELGRVVSANSPLGDSRMVRALATGWNFSAP